MLRLQPNPGKLAAVERSRLVKSSSTAIPRNPFARENHRAQRRTDTTLRQFESRHPPPLSIKNRFPEGFGVLQQSPA